MRVAQPPVRTPAHRDRRGRRADRAPGAAERAPRLAIGDLSRPHVGDFGIRYGPIGHASHQNGLDADVYYSRADGRERAPRGVADIDPPALTELVDRFVQAGAEVVFVGPNPGLTGPAGRVVRS